MHSEVQVTLTEISFIGRASTFQPKKKKKTTMEKDHQIISVCYVLKEYLFWKMPQMSSYLQLLAFLLLL